MRSREIASSSSFTNISRGTRRLVKREEGHIAHRALLRRPFHRCGVGSG